MKLHHRYLIVMAILLALTAIWLPTYGAVRTVLVEGFTQWNCNPCATWNPTERAILNAMTRDTVISIKFHGWWPGANNDAFYLWNQSENSSRISFYGVTWVPWVMVDGILNLSNVNANQLRTYVRQRRAGVAPCAVNCYANASGETSVTFSSDIIVETSTSGNLRVFAALISDLTVYPSPPGSNGETQFPDAFRDMYPNMSGQTITMTAGDTIHFEGTLNKAAAWDPDNLSVLVFVQNTGTKEIYQTGWAEVTRDWGMTVTGHGPRQLIQDPNAGETTYTIDLTNIGLMDETYHVELTGTLPTGWTRSVEAFGVPADPNSIDVHLESSNQITLTAHLNPNGNPGGAVLNVVINSPSSPEPIIATETFRLMAGLDILLVDDDDGDIFETWYEEALTATAGNYMWGRWDAHADSLDAAYFTGLDAVIWFTGNIFQDGHTISAADQEMLSAFLDNGGKLFLSGQGIGFDIRLDPFFSDYLHAHYDRNYPTGVNVSGVTDDPISDGMSFSLSGGDGASNQTRQAAISPADANSTVFLEYDSSAFHAGLRTVANNFRIVYLGFGFEAVNSAAARTALMQNSLDWLFGIEAADDGRTLLIPAKFALGYNYPNPFNPETVIPYALPARSEITLRVFDMLGREVAVLATGMQEAGYHSAVWNAADFSSGVYFYRLEATSGTQSFRDTNKLVVLK
jgi:hypothetical protein